MALRDQPYLPLYVKDFTSDEKLRMCSAESYGVYILTMCVMHTTDEYGVIALSSRDLKSDDQIENFARFLLHQLPFEFDVIRRSLQELIDRGVLCLDGNRLIQKRMLKDGKRSSARALAGSLGGIAKSESVAKSKKNFSKTPSKTLANTAIENEDIVLSSSCDKSTGDTGVQGEKNPRAELSQVMTLYLDRINPAPSEFCIDLLKSYTEDMGADVVCRAINKAIDSGALNWNYIKTILQSWTKDKVKCIADVDKLEAKAGKWEKRDIDVQGGYHYDPGSMEGSL